LLVVRRAGVTTALHVLDGGLMIRATRELIVMPSEKWPGRQCAPAIDDPENQ
jgi:hypothetical protein